MEPFKRKSAEEILASIMKLRQGRLNILVGAFSGSGKTYHMLQEGLGLKEQGLDVVICTVSAMQRPEVIRQIGDMEIIPGIRWFNNDEEREDLDMNQLIERRPEVVLADGLAHRNRKGAKFPTRLDDIQYLLGHGISVITTVNIYELEDATEVARQWTGMKVEETVPAHTLELADEVRLIDVTPETLLERAFDGQLSNQIPDWYKRGNLAKLRELALRMVAGGVNGALEKHREDQGLVGSSGVAERILVSVQYHWNGSIYVRRGQQVAKRLGGDLRVVSFVHPKKSLSNEAAAFRTSIIRLTEKVNGIFEEIPLYSRRELPGKLMQDAVSHNVSRIVMGHSRQSPWQDFWKGNIAYRLLKKIRNIDLLFVADRTEREGERILPARSQSEEQRGRYRRLSETEVEAQIGRIRRGKCKIYIGAAPGVGKTYTMLREGNDLLAKGVDVVIGLIETHGRKETLAQVGSLTVIPRMQRSYRGTVLEEMDVEAVLRRKPEVVLVDELAHTNIPGSENRKRYEDVLTILESGISVISTMNVQHLESLNDAVEQITGIRVRETVPDSMLHQADEIQLIDVAPRALQERMKAGKIYAADKVNEALGRFFKLGNLIALRELALRELADDVDERLESWDRRDSLRGPWRREEMIFIGITPGHHAERLIRRGFRIAFRLKAKWFVVYVHVGPAMTEKTAARMDALRQLTVLLGGEFDLQYRHSDRQVAASLLDMAEHRKATQLIVGQSARDGWKRWTRRSVVKTLLRDARHLDVLVVSEFDPDIQLGESKRITM
ncbi:universal stress protein [Cohnella sp.]|uniref:universal stress protein n=1 Tax=Cohnella sp. TaxID=1883426 RepID=UPI00356AA69A